jgi:uncharacterized protein YdiU (UPF0061 family)
MTLLSLESQYGSLPAHFFAPATPTAVRQAALMHLNQRLASTLGLDPAALATPEGLDVLAGNRVPDGANPLSMAYSGHQFGGFNPSLGDGRAILLGEVRDPAGTLWDIQLKGAGLTPFSRYGSDGRNWVGPVLREYVISEAMHALGIPTTRALAAVSTGQPIRRERLYPGAILTRVGQSHIRIGTFEYLAHNRDRDGLEVLTKHVLDRHYPASADADNPALALLTHVMQRQVHLITHWLSVGFIHGVMNTDNTSVIGDTIDYGPCAFMDTYHPAKVFSSIDHYGRYAYANQPRVAHWNLSVFANTMVPLLGDGGVQAAQSVLNAFPDAFAQAHLSMMRGKLGLQATDEQDGALAADLMTTMADNEADFTLTFRHLSHMGRAPSPADDAVRAQFNQPRDFDLWSDRWRDRLEGESATDAERQARMLQTNPAYIPRNHQIEAMIQAAIGGNYGPMQTLIEVLATPFEERAAFAEYADAPTAGQEVCETFCGT